MDAIATAVVEFYRRHRRDLPWRRTRDPYAIWVSEIMLQQTRVATVIPYWQRWMARFPTVAVLADSPIADVLAAWSGLGYYSRARNLHRGAQWVRDRGGVPQRAHDLREVPGIGAYTAGAIASIAWGERAPLVDGNVARVLARLFAIEDDIKSAGGQKRIWALAGELMSALPADADPGAFNQGLMELGATVCTPTSPTCLTCPLTDHCAARRSGRQGELPRVPARRRTAELPELATVALWIERRGKILMAQRPAAGLYGGMWELPQGVDADAAARAVGLELTGGALLVGEHRQVLSHRRLFIRLMTARTRGSAAPAPGGYQAVRWVADDERSSLGLSSATSALLAKSPPKAPRPSLGKGLRPG